MSATLTRPDKRIIRAFKRIVETAVPATGVEYRYNGAGSHPLFGTCTYTTGMVMGRTRTLQELQAFLGTEGYLDSANWHERGNYLSIGIGHDQGIWITNNAVPDSSHAVGLHGTKFFGNTSPDFNNLEFMRRHRVRTEEEVIRLTVKLLKRRR